MVKSKIERSRDVRKKIKSFIDNQLENCVKDDQKKCRILSEFDLQVSVNRCLQEYFKSETIKDWYILNEHYFRKVAHKIQKTKQGKKKKWISFKPDIVIVHKKKAGKMLTEFILELKEFKNQMPKQLKIIYSDTLNEKERDGKRFTIIGIKNE